MSFGSIDIVELPNHPTNVVSIVHTCTDHTDVRDEPPGRHLFRLDIALPGLPVSIGPYYSHEIFIQAFCDSLETLVMDRGATLEFRLYPLDLENQAGFLWLRVFRFGPNSDLIGWEFKIDGPQIEPLWKLTFTLHTYELHFTAIKKACRAMLHDLNDPCFVQIT